MSIPHHAAKVISKRRNNLSQCVMGELREALGTEAYAYALANRWLVPDMESGELYVTQEAGRLQTMRTLAEDDSEMQIGDSVDVADDGQTYTGAVSALNPDGTYKVSFGDRRPMRERPYKVNEIRRLGTVPSSPNEVAGADPNSPVRSVASRSAFPVVP